mgnify:CR=1 FL=1
MVKSKAWSIAAIILGIIAFVIGLVIFFVAAIAGRTSLTPVATTCYIMTIVGIVVGAITVFCASQRTEWKVNMVAGFANLAKIGIMLCIIVLAATLMNA